MKYQDLAVSPIVFNEADHSYEDKDGFLLTGVTSILKSVLFPNKYAGISEDILMRASEHGTNVHHVCQMHDILGLESDLPELARYKAIKEENGISMIAAEYLVSDERLVATMIDCIDSDGNLYDIKTTYNLDEEYLSWQLSFCSWLFEKQNPELKAGKLFAIWLRPDKHRLVEVPRKPNDEVERVLRAFLSGDIIKQEETTEIRRRSGEMNSPRTGDIIKQEETTEIARVANIEAEIIRFKEQLNALEEEKKNVMKALKKYMEDNGLKKIETDRVLVTIVADSKSKTFDSARFKKEHPELSDEYMKESVLKGYVKITLR